jgi:hypothetical protein
VEGLGPRHLRQAIQVGGFAVLIAVGLVLVVARTNALTGVLFG